MAAVVVGWEVLGVLAPGLGVEAVGGLMEREELVSLENLEREAVVEVRIVPVQRPQHPQEEPAEHPGPVEAAAGAEGLPE